MARRPIIAGNWKLNKGTADEAKELTAQLVSELGKIGDISGVDVVVCPPYTVLHTVQAGLGDGGTVFLGAQNVFWKESGAYTGRISAPMLVGAGVKYVIIGHSEARGRYGVPEPDFTEDVLRHFGETDATVNRKIRAALDAGLVPIVCVGETLAERESGTTDSVIETQVTGALAGLTSEQAAGLVFAYEPVWAIGTGKTCSPDEADRVCGMIRSLVARIYDTQTGEGVRIQYGGSMNATNAADLLGRTSIDGGLIGGASLKPADFATIVRAALG